MPTPATVTGTLQTLTSGKIAQGKVIFQLTNIGSGNPISVTGTSVIPALTYTAMTAQDGTFSTPLWGNDNINPANTLYAVTFRDFQGNEIGPVLFNIIGASANLNSAVPVSNVLPPVFVIVASPPINTSKLNNIRFADQFPGADASIKINAAIADVIAAGGGTVDARGFAGAQTISQQINVGQNTPTIPVTLLLPPFGTWTISITDGVSTGIRVFSGGTIIGGGQVTGPTLIITGTGTTNVDSFMDTDPNPVGGGSYVRIEGGFQLYNPSGSTIVTACMNVRKCFDNSIFRGFTVANYSVSDGLRVYSCCCGTSFYNITSNSNGTGKRPVFIQADAVAANADISFYGLSAGHPGSGFADVEISGGATAPTNAVNRNINFYGLWTEDSTVNADFGLKIVDARGVNVYGWTFNGTASANPAYIGLDISQTGASQVRNIDVYGFAFASAGTTTGINNHITGKTYMTSTAYKPRYFYGGTSGTQSSQPTTIEDNELDIFDAAGVLQYQFPTSGVAVFGGSPVARAIASGTATMTTALIAAGAAGTTVTVAATGALTTDVIIFTNNAAVVANNGVLVINAWPTAGNVNFNYCNPTAAGITPTAATLNWRVVR